MQEISLENLKKLLPDGKMDESLFGSARREDIGNGLKFKDVCDAYNRQMDRLEGESGEYGIDRLRPQAYSYMNRQVLSRHCPPIVLVGEGSSRAAYACVGGKCVKIAKNAAGVVQNRQELKHTEKRWLKKLYGCFVYTYGSNGSDCGVILAECCAPCRKPDQLAEAFGISSVNVLNAVIAEVAKAKKCDVTAATANLKKLSSSGGREFKFFYRALKDTVSEALEFLEGMASRELSEMSPAERSLSELFRFWQKNGVDELMPGDIQDYQNWGFAIRDGQIAPVVLDVGFSRDVKRRYY